MKVLVVDDKLELCESIAEILELDGHEVTKCSNGKQAIDSIYSLSPELIITDILMPEKDGYELILEIRKKPQTQHIPIIVISAMAAEYEIQTALNFGANSYLLKPFSSDELRQSITQAIRSSKD